MMIIVPVGLARHVGGEQHTERGENSAMASLFPILLFFLSTHSFALLALLRPLSLALVPLFPLVFLSYFPPLALPSLLSGCPSSSAQQLVLLRFPLFFFIPPSLLLPLPPLLLSLLLLLLPPPSLLLLLSLDSPSLPSSFTGRTPAAKRRRKWLPRRRRQSRKRSCWAVLATT